jgi:hypothetical protein
MTTISVGFLIEKFTHDQHSNYMYEIFVAYLKNWSCRKNTCDKKNNDYKLNLNPAEGISLALLKYMYKNGILFN